VHVSWPAPAGEARALDSPIKFEVPDDKADLLFNVDACKVRRRPSGWRPRGLGWRMVAHTRLQ
jgi:hypothetical protein